ncbi:MAG: hypothetical protein RLZZ179_603 [Verrucomicrobiota bacterium]
MDPLRAAGPIPEGFVAPQSKVSTFSFVAPRLVEEFLAALPVRVLQQALRARFSFCFGPKPKPSRPRKSSRQGFGHCRKVYCCWVADGGVKPDLASGGAGDFSRQRRGEPVAPQATVLRLVGIPVGAGRQMPAPWARSWRYSVRMDRTAITAASMRSGSGARPGVSKTISRARGRCSGGALRTPG